MSKKTLIVLTVLIAVASIILALTNFLIFGVEIAFLMVVIIIAALGNIGGRLKGQNKDMLILKQIAGITLPGVIFGFIASCIARNDVENLIRVFIVFAILLIVIKKINSRRSLK